MRSALALLLLLAAGNSQAAAPAATDGVWQGTLGKAAIVACFDGSQGTYYYLKHGRDIQLERKDPTQPFAEQPYSYASEATGYWHVDVEAGELRGSWTSPSKGKPPLPIRAQRVAPAHADDDACQSDAFAAPRMQQLQLLPREALQAGLPVRIRKATGTDIEGLQLRGTESGFANINRALDKDFHEALADSWDCSDFSTSPSLEYADARWIVVRVDSGSYCGGAHPDSGTAFLTFERGTGKSVDTSTWLVDLEGTDAGKSFWQLSASKLQRPEEECVDAWRDGSGYAMVRPSPHGVRVDASFPHVLAACEDTIELSPAQARPFLTPEGRRALGIKP